MFRLFLKEFDGLLESNSAFPQCDFIGLVCLVALAFVNVLVTLVFVVEPIFVLLSPDVILCWNYKVIRSQRRCLEGLFDDRDDADDEY